jgi:predicted metal-dependent hydrolase
LNVIEAAALLGTLPRAPDDTIRQAYREAAARWHPDRGGLTDAMQRINAAKSYLLKMPRETRVFEAMMLKSQENAIIDAVLAEQEEWESRRPVSNEPPVTNSNPQDRGKPENQSVTNNDSPKQAYQSVTNKKSVPGQESAKESVTNKRRAAAWEERNREKVREQTRERVARHREQHNEEYKAYMREYMRKRRAAARAAQ